MRLQLLLMLPVLLLAGCKKPATFWLEDEGVQNTYQETETGSLVTFNWDFNAITEAAKSDIVAASITPLLGSVSLSGPAQAPVTRSNFYRFEGQTVEGTTYRSDPVEVVALHQYCGNANLSLNLDLWVPNTPPPAEGYPAVVVIHGGSWSDGNYSEMYQLTHALSQSGFVAAAIQYRLSDNGDSQTPTGIWPAHIQDAKCAVRWLRNQTLVDVDSGRIGATGWSAGANLALMLGVTDQSTNTTAAQLIANYRNTLQYTTTDDSVQAVASVAGPVDLLDTWQRVSIAKDSPDIHVSEPAKIAYASIPLLFPNNPPGDGGNNDNIFRQNSPLNFVDEDTASRVAFLILHGKDDQMVPFEDGCKFVSKLESFGGNATALHYEGTDTTHFSFFKFRFPHVLVRGIRGYGTQSDSTIQDVVNFFNAHLRADPIEPQYSVNPSSCP